MPKVIDSATFATPIGVCHAELLITFIPVKSSKSEKPKFIGPIFRRNLHIRKDSGHPKDIRVSFTRRTVKGRKQQVVRLTDGTLLHGEDKVEWSTNIYVGKVADGPAIKSGVGAYRAIAALSKLAWSQFVSVLDTLRIDPEEFFRQPERIIISKEVEAWLRGLKEEPISFRARVNKKWKEVFPECSWSVVDLYDHDGEGFQFTSNP